MKETSTTVSTPGNLLVNGAKEIGGSWSSNDENGGVEPAFERRAPELTGEL